MKASGQDSTGFGLETGPPGAGLHRFSHEAMATVFEVICAHPDRDYARQGAQAAFDLVDRLERELSRFIENSDVSRINHLAHGQCVQVSPWTMECLQIARQAYTDTGGAFDISMGTGLESLDLMPDGFEVCAHVDGVRLDLGGIGKGYTVDRVVELLEEWEIHRALVHGGFSSVRAMDPPGSSTGWPVTLSCPGPASGGVLARLDACRRALSGSGIRKPDHILDPRKREPVRDRLAVWVSIPVSERQAERSDAGPTGAGASPAAVAEALSTAFMILSPGEIAGWCREHPGLEAWLIPQSPGPGASAPGFLHFPPA